MSDWDDLFRAAQGIGVETTTAKRDAMSLDGASSAANSSAKHVQKKRKSSNEDIPSVEIRGSPRDAILRSRMDPIEEQIWKSLPSWILVGESLGNSSNKKVCNQWMPQSKTSLDAKCQNCGLSIIHHSLHVSSTTRITLGKSLDMFLLVRNIRCCCTCILLDHCHYNNHYPSTGVRIKDYVRTAMTEAEKLINIHGLSLNNRHPGEAEILEMKIQKIAESTKALHQQMRVTFARNDKFPLQGIFDNVVQIMIDCDAAYFRMYYLQNAGMMKVPSSKAFLPHPVTYFGSSNLCWSCDDRCLTNYLLKIQSDFTHSTMRNEKWDELVSHLGIGNDPTLDLDKLDPMTFLHKNRMMESMHIFWESGWMDASSDSWCQMAVHSTGTPQQTSVKSNDESEDEFYKKHHTLAPSILQRWRDSCRDFLCNLYAYATLLPETYSEVESILKRMNTTKILEMGAGTGYIALQFKKLGIDISAYDLVPTTCQLDEETSNFNEYHGSSPPYFNVQGSHPGLVKSLLKNKKEAKKTALLLCYPPPLSSMAEDTLKCYMESGGRVVVHIGEFKGLTGCESFERMLMQEYQVVHRSPCLHWGTDAAEITVWKKQTSKNNASSLCSLLVPCSYCGKKESRRRLLLYRPLVYCSNDCFQAHTNERNVQLSLFMIPSEIVTENSHTFQLL